MISVVHFHLQLKSHNHIWKVDKNGFLLNATGFPLGLENLENGKVFSSQGKVWEF